MTVNSSLEMFDLRSGNVIANYADEREAWDALRQAALEFGLEELEGLALAHIENERSTLIAMEHDLVQRVAREVSEANGASVKSRSDTPGRVAS